MSLSKLGRFEMNAVASALLVVLLGVASAAFADSPTPLALKMDVMATAMKNLSHPGTPPAAANPLDDLKQLKDTVADCLAHSDDLAPAAVASNPQALQGFKAEFALLATKVDALETALSLPADASGRDVQIQAALDAITAVKKDGHSKYKP